LNYNALYKHDPRKNYFCMPNQIYNIGLNDSEIAIYGYLLSLEDKKYQCWPSYKTIGKAVGLGKVTVMKYINSLEEKCLIKTEYTSVIRENGMKYNGNLRYTIRPFQDALDHYYRRQMDQLELQMEVSNQKKKARKKADAFDKKYGTQNGGFVTIAGDAAEQPF